MNQVLEEIIGRLNLLSADELLHLRDEIDDHLEESDARATFDGDQELSPVERSSTGRYRMPRMSKLFEWGAVKAGDSIYVDGHKSEAAVLVDHKMVDFNGQQMTIYEWAKQVSGWKSINVYISVMLERERRPLWQVRRDAMEAHGLKYPD